MANTSNNTSVARQVEIFIRRLNSLSTLPEIASGFLSQLANGKIDTAVLTDIVESDPALTAKVYSLAHSEGIVFPDRPSVSVALGQMPDSTIRDAILSVKVFQVFESQADPDSKRILPRKQLALHAIAVGCCCRLIAECLLEERDWPLAFTAGLLHDIGKLAIDEVMPKSFERIVEEARADKVSMCSVEQEHLGLDHAVIGKRLAEKWHLPPQVVMAIWLHHSDTAAISANISAGKLASIVHLGDMIARQCNIGHSGSFDSVASIAEVAEGLCLDSGQLEKIRVDLEKEVAKRSDMLGLEASAPAAVYYDLVQETAARLARDNSDLEAQNKTLTRTSSQMDMVKGFLADINLNMSAIELAGRFGLCWQRNYQSGPVCVYLQESEDEPFLEMATVSGDGQQSCVVLNVPAGAKAIPDFLHERFAVLDAFNCASWIFEQIDLEFDLARTRMAPLLVHGRAIGAIIFQQNQPGTAEMVEDYSVEASIAAGVVALSQMSEQHSRLAERFAELLGRLKDAREQISAAKLLNGIAEMAAGAGHELNNPLAVISGRAQLLLEVETDENKKQMLKQIQDRTDEMSGIVNDLMTFARPRQPDPRPVMIGEVLEDAVSSTMQKHELSELELKNDGVASLAEARVDKGQAVNLLANILSNSLESYKGGNGPIYVDGTCSQPEGAVVFTISDFGCGMDADTLENATKPFFSGKAAGRKRGMGLSQAARLIQINNGTLTLQSEPGKGTVVTIKLPRA